MNSFPACCATYVYCAQELDEALYEECKRKYEEDQASKRSVEEARERKWELLQKVASQKAGGRYGMRG